MHQFDYEVKTQKPEILKLVGKPYKFLLKEYSSPTVVDIFGDYVVTFVGGSQENYTKSRYNLLLKPNY